MNEEKKTGTPKDSHYARLRRTHRDRKQAGGAAKRSGALLPPSLPDDGLIRLYGIHTVRAALDNPGRKIRRLLLTRNAMPRLGLGEPLAFPFPAEIVTK